MTDQNNARLADDQDAAGEAGGADVAPRSSSRRRLFLAGAGVAGAAVLAKAGTASAADDDPALVGNANEGELTTEFVNTADADALQGTAQGAGTGVVGDSAEGYGGAFSIGEDGKAHVRLVQAAAADAAGPPTGDGHLLGELYLDGAGNLWLNVADGENFRRLNNQGGINLFPDAQRAYDSREEFTDPPNTNKGRHTAGEIRTIDLTEFTDFPAGASGAVVNLTVADTGEHGFATLFNGDTADADRPNVSHVNYRDAGMFVANGVMVAVGAAGTLKVYTLAETEVIIDVVGYIGDLPPAPPAEPVPV